MTIINDHEFGSITLRRSRRAKYARLVIGSGGSLRISLPMYAPPSFAADLLEGARQKIRQNLARIRQNAPPPLKNGDLIGKAHRLAVLNGEVYGSRLNGQELQITIPEGEDPASAAAQKFIRQAAAKALRVQAKAYLSRRLSALANEYGFKYNDVRFSNASTRWGSCSTKGTISLNIWLMRLPMELIDYVLIHELCHTRHMNHSPRFWNEVESIMPDYKSLRKELKQSRPDLI